MMIWKKENYTIHAFFSPEKNICFKIKVTKNPPNGILNKKEALDFIASICEKVQFSKDDINKEDFYKVQSGTLIAEYKNYDSPQTKSQDGVLTIIDTKLEKQAEEERKSFLSKLEIAEKNSVIEIQKMVNKINKLIDSHEILRLKIKGDDLDFEIGNATTPDSIKEYTRGARLEEKYKQLKKLEKIEIQIAKLKQRYRIYNAISNISDTSKRRRIYVSADLKSNEELIKIVSNELAEQEIERRTKEHQIRGNCN